MKKEMAITKNVRRYLGAVRQLWDRPYGVEGLGILYGYAGEGKTMATDYVIDQTNGINLRVKRHWTITSMLHELCDELKVARSNRKAPMVEAIIRQLLEKNQPLFIDEVDRLFTPGHTDVGMDILETFRDIYDTTKVPIILIGEENTAINIQKNGRFARRITQWVEFNGLDEADARIYADTVCEVAIADDLLMALYQASSANIGRMHVGLTTIERKALASGLDVIDLATWGDQQYFFDQPIFRKQRTPRR